MSHVSGITDISAVVRRRKALAFSTFAAQILSIVVVSVAMGFAAENLLWNPPVQLFFLVTAAVAFLTVRVTRRLRWGDRRVAWAVVAVLVPFLAAIFVGAPLQAAGKVQLGIFNEMLGQLDGFGEGLAVGFPAIALLSTAPVVYFASDSAVLRTRLKRRAWRWLALVLLGLITFIALITLMAVLAESLPPWALTIVLINIPLALLVVPGLYVVLTDRPNRADGVWLPTAAELAAPASARRAVTVRWGTEAIVFQALSVLVALLGICLIGLANNPPAGEPGGLGPVRWAIALGLLVGAVALGRAARARAMPSAEEIVGRDRRAPILYLRSFRDDDLRLRTRRSPRRTLLDNYVAILLLGVFVRLRERFEEVLVWQLWWHGPVIAVGDPVRRPYRLGSPRLYMPQDQWQHQIQTLMQASRFIVVVLGRTEGLAWELQCLGRLGLGRKLLVVIPPAPEPELTIRTQTFGDIAAGAGLPRPEPGVFDDTLAAVVPLEGKGWRTFSGRSRDEWSYEVALEAAALELGAQPSAAYSPSATDPRSKASRLSIISLACSIIGLFACGSTSLAGIVLGHIARRRILHNRGNGLGLATAGIIIGYAGILLNAVLLLLFLMAFPRPEGS